ENQPLYHQFRDPAHLAKWQAALAVGQTKLKTLETWVSTGRYPGLWTVTDPNGWFAGEKAIQLKPRKGFVLFDPDIPEHQKVYAEWRALNDRVRPGAPNRFAALKGADGTSLSQKVAGVRAPDDERFYREMGIAGVAHY